MTKQCPCSCLPPRPHSKRQLACASYSPIFHSADSSSTKKRLSCPLNLTLSFSSFNLPVSQGSRTSRLRVLSILGYPSNLMRVMPPQGATFEYLATCCPLLPLPIGHTATTESDRYDSQPRFMLYSKPHTLSRKPTHLRAGHTLPRCARPHATNLLVSDSLFGWQPQ